MRGFSVAAVLVTALVLVTNTAGGQVAPATIVVSASAEVEAAPDRANLRVGVETRGRTAVETATANSRIQTAVLAAIRNAGVEAAQLRTNSVNVSPVYEYSREGGRATLTGYQASNGVNVEIRDLSKVAAVLDAALSAGATNVDGPHFSLADDSGPRRSAVELAVKKARADAEAMASAAGVRITGVLEIITGDTDAPMVEFAARRLSSMSADIATPVESGRISVSAKVIMRFSISAP